MWYVKNHNTQTVINCSYFKLLIITTVLVHRAYKAKAATGPQLRGIGGAKPPLAANLLLKVY